MQITLIDIEHDASCKNLAGFLQADLVQSMYPIATFNRTLRSGKESKSEAFDKVERLAIC